MGKEKSPSMVTHGKASFPCSAVPTKQFPTNDTIKVGTPLQDEKSRKGVIETNNPRKNRTSEIESEIDKNFRPHKNKSVRLSEIYEYLGMMPRAYRVKECGTLLEFWASADEQKLHFANFCKDRLCPMCTWRRSLKLFSQVSRIMDVLQADGYQFIFLTLTVKNCAGHRLPETCDMIFDGFRKMYHKNKVFRSSVVGTFRAFEVTRNADRGDYHPHLHLILAVRPDYFKGKGYITQKAWQAMWKSVCALEYDPIVYVEKCRGKSKDNNTDSGSDSDRDLSSAVAEACKYTVKSADFLSDDTEESAQYVQTFLDALAGRRLCSFTGVFAKVRKQLALDDLENGDLVHVDDEKLREDVAYMVVKYRWCNGVYVRALDLEVENG